MYLRLFIKIIWHRYSIPPGTRTWTPSSRSFITPSSRSFITPSSRRFITPSSRRFITRRRRRSSRRPRRVPAVVSGFRPGSVQTRLLFFLESVTLQTIQDLPPDAPPRAFSSAPAQRGFRSHTAKTRRPNRGRFVPLRRRRELFFRKFRPPRAVFGNPRDEKESVSQSGMGNRGGGVWGVGKFRTFTSSVSPIGRNSVVSIRVVSHWYSVT